MRGVGAAQRKMGKIQKMLSREEFDASPIVSEAMEKTGKKGDELNFEDLVERAVANGEIPDTEEARNNCFALVQFMQGEDRITTPMLVIKLTVGRPIIEK
jgi:hypothetical protein